MQIREMTIDDYDAVYALWSHTGNLGLRSLDDSREGIRRFLKRNPHSNFIAATDHNVIGVILCGNDGRRGYIYHTVVHKNFRNQGIGTQLVNAAINALQKEGITRVCLHVMKTNEPGKRFWINHGWEEKAFLGFYSKSITGQENRPLFEYWEN